MKKQQRFDGLWVGLGDWSGNVVELVDAPWWKIGRWIAYFFRTPKADRTFIEFGLHPNPARKIRARVVQRRNVQVIPYQP